MTGPTLTKGDEMKSMQSVLARLAAGAALCAGLTLSGGALAQAPSCKADLAKFCPQAKPGGGQIAACLKQNTASAFRRPARRGSRR